MNGELKPLEVDTSEEQRLAALNKTRLMDTPAEGRFDRITRLTQRHFGVAISQISLVGRDRVWHKSSRGTLGLLQIPREYSFCSRAIESDSALVIADTHLDPVYAQNPLVTGAPFIRFYAGQPIKYAGQRLGTLCLADRQVRHLDPNQLEDLEGLATWVESEVDVDCLSSAERELLSQIDELKQVALMDHLTRAWNRAGIEEVYAREQAQARREGAAISLIMIDIDHFKKVNDTLGHVAGDAVLKKVADRIRLSIRPYDALGRMGGEEFLVIMPATPASGASVAAERIRHGVSRFPLELPEGGEVSVTISLGVTTIEPGPSQDYSLSRYTKRADEALYASKRLGRNRVSIA